MCMVGSFFFFFFPSISDKQPIIQILQKSEIFKVQRVPYFGLCTVYVSTNVYKIFLSFITSKESVNVIMNTTHVVNIKVLMSWQKSNIFFSHFFFLYMQIFTWKIIVESIVNLVAVFLFEIKSWSFFEKLIYFFINCISLDKLYANFLLKQVCFLCNLNNIFIFIEQYYQRFTV